MLLQGTSVTIANALDVRDNNSSSKSSSFGVSIGAYEDISGAAHALADLPSALGSARGGAAALAINTAATAQSTVRSVMNAMTSTAALAQTINRDTSGANAGALVQQFDEAKRQDIAQGFQAAQTLAAETTAFLSTQAAGPSAVS